MFTNVDSPPLYQRGLALPGLVCWSGLCLVCAGLEGGGEGGVGN